MRVLVIEDDATLGRALQEFLTDQGYVTDWIAEGVRGLNALLNHPYDLVVLDLNLPDVDGLSVLRSLRDQEMSVPVLILTARDGLQDRVHGLDAGADDYLTKPFELAEFAARVRALARRHVGLSRSIVEFGTISFDTTHRELRIGGERVTLSVRELSVLEMLMQRAGKVVTKQQIVQGLSALDANFSENAVEVYIYRLRKRLEGRGAVIQTVRGFGYLLELETSHS
ncbi:response regulator transcription factor [Orrella sp. NBD-18]|uniref:Response regulator transcription factor n=1 Tax=Sheuella amnicola TaxID=2707330 RepID=A0A6B2QWQ3_9BURK|nr:response regulator transcription factor [Sheuella amnicola]NDY81694.1 response regulator transcription factor [Sheuella amnicola]